MPFRAPRGFFPQKKLYGLWENMYFEIKIKKTKSGA